MVGLHSAENHAGVSCFS